MPLSPEEINKNAARIEQESRRFFDRSLKFDKKALDQEMMELHEEVFKGVDCLTCANCCKTISPVFKERDIKNLSRHLGLKPGALVEKYLRLDEDGDYVPNAIPCSFLQSDNKCSVYDFRPAACRSYPHTDSLPVSKSVNLVIKNSSVCPAVHEMVRLLTVRHSAK